MTTFLRRAIYIFLLIFGIPFWVVAVTLLTFVAWLCVVGYELWPDADYGNCWTYALRMYAVYGGYVCIRNAHGRVKFLKVFPVPHIIWANTLPPDIEVQQFVPDNRRSGSL